MPDSLLGFSLDEFVSNDESNRKTSIRNLESYWSHFTDLSHRYDVIYKSVSQETFRDPSKYARHLFLANSYTNLVPAICRILEGHFTDSANYNRKTAEAVRTSIFIRENPNMAELWTQTGDDKIRKKFENAFRNWYRDGGKAITLSECSWTEDLFKMSSNIGSHANYHLITFQNDFEKVNDGFKAKLLFHEISPNKLGYWQLLNFYFWTLSNHFLAVDWWTEKSGLQFDISKGLNDLWTNNRKRYAASDADVAPRALAGTLEETESKAPRKPVGPT